MVEILKVFKENIPTMRFIGKKYDDFGHWDEWWQNGWFDVIEKTMVAAMKSFPFGKTEAVISVLKDGKTERRLNII